MNQNGYRILHTSDWHLGNTLHDRPRDEEFSAFLKWLKTAIVQNGVDALLVSGDVFDTGAPGNRTQEQYYSFLTSLNGTCCKNVIVTAGNHDSPSTLQAASSVLDLLKVHVVATPDAENGFGNEICVLPDAADPKLIVCAAPYLREPALRASVGDEEVGSDEELAQKGTRAHFAKLLELAKEKRKALNGNIPIVAMAHLFASGAEPSENAAESEYAIVGNLKGVSAGVFPPDFDYVALGHIHRAQRVAGEDRIRYAGSPLPMGFDEADRENCVLLVDFVPGESPVIRPLGVPRMRKLLTISGTSPEEIRQRIRQADLDFPQAFIRIRYTGSGSLGNLRELFAADFEKTTLKLLKAEYGAQADASQAPDWKNAEDLSELRPGEIFARLLDSYADGKCGIAIDAGLKKNLEKEFEDVLRSVQEGETAQ